MQRNTYLLLIILLLGSSTLIGYKSITYKNLSMKKYGLHGSLKAKEGKGKELANILLEASELVAKAKGCQIYIVSQDPEQPDLIWVTEVWDSKADHEASLSYPGVRELISQALPILDGPPQKGQVMEVMGGQGLH